MTETERGCVQWQAVPTRDGLDPARFLGRLTELPRECLPGDWCEVVVRDASGEMRWTLLVVETPHRPSIFAERRNGRVPAR